MSTGVEQVLIDLLAVFLIAAGVGVAVAKIGRFPYTIALLIAGIAVSLVGGGPMVELTHDVILLVLLPPLLFQGAATTDLEAFRSDLGAILLLAIVGLLGSILLVGVAVNAVLGIPLLLSLLFAIVVLPTDPVSVLALFDELGAPERLSVLVEGESLVNDGLGVVLYTTALTLVEQDVDPAALLQPARLLELAGDVAVVSVGGAVVGFAAGYLVYRVMANLDEHMTEIVLTIIVAYGSFLVAEHFVGVSGVIATVVAGLFVGNRGAEHAMSARTKVSVFNTWETAAFLVNTFIFIAIGVATPIRQIVANAELLLPAIALVLVGRAATVYPLSTLYDAVTPRNLPNEYKHVLVWGGLHGSIPVALTLGLPPTLPMREQIRVMVFGIVAFSLVVQGLTMEQLVDRLGIATTSEEERLYQLLKARGRAISEALSAAERLNEEGRIPSTVYERFEEEYGQEKDDLDGAIATLLSEHPEIREQEQIVGERQVLTRERSAIQEAEREGTIGSDVAERLLEEVDLKMDRVRSGQRTVTADDEESYEEFWRERAHEQGLLDEADEETDDESATGTPADDGDDD